MSQWAAFNKRNKFSNAVKSLLATSDARLVCSIAEVSKHGGLLKGELIIQGALCLDNVKIL